jgi:predicted transcriptional regulator YheO
MNRYIVKFLPLVDFLADVLGSDAEIVLHDIQDVGSSVVAIRNNHISGRDVGAPATNLVLKIMKDARYSDLDYVSNYRGISETGKTLKSSTFFIRDSKRNLVGMLCINIDIEKFTRLKDFVDNFIGLPQVTDDKKIVERFSTSVEKLALDSIETVVSRAGVPPERMTQNERIAIIQELNKDGVFLLKGAISEVAEQLKVSEVTIYRYLNGVKKADRS